MEELEHLAATGPARITAASSTSELDAVEADLVGRKSRLAELRRNLGKMDEAERKVLGARLGEVQRDLAAFIESRRLQLGKAEEDARLAEERIDVTLPGRAPVRGSHHLVSQTLDEIVNIFVSIGYTVATGPEAETEWYNFTALNIGEHHPARLETDTLYLDYGPNPEEILLRTHTSPMQARYMETNPPPVYLVVPGRVYRAEDVDPTHSPVFHQVEGLAVDTDITFADLKGTLAYFARQFFGEDEEVKFVPDYFPFTEPSAQMHVSCFSCHGQGCRICERTGWIELLGCGMVNPHVLETVGYDPAVYSGFAFGMGADRMGMVRHGLNDLRHLFEGDVRVLEQFR